jgi:uncharacterized protein (TIGR00304 family)
MLLMVESLLISIGVAIIFIGVLVVAAGTFFHASSGGVKTGVKAGGVVMIGPIPLIFGTDRSSAFAAIGLAIILMLVYYFILKR